MPLFYTRREPSRVAAAVSGLYVLVAAAWIILSDRLVGLVAVSPSEITAFQTAKGWGFVLVTGIALYLLIRRELTLSRRSEARLEVLAEQSLAGVFVLENGTITGVNQRLLSLLGYEDREELIATDLARIVHPENFDVVRKLSRVSARDAPEDKRFRIRMFRKSGEEIHVDVVVGRIELEGAATTVGLVLDSTEQVQLEKQVRRAQRMETLGRLTGAIAHDYNNLLTAIVGPLDLCLDSLPGDHPTREDVQLARTTAERAASLSRRLLTFSKKRIARRRVVDLNGPVGGLRPLIEQLTGDPIAVRFEPADDMLPVYQDEAQLEQVLMNLVVNAVDAMPRGGELTVTTRRVPGSSSLLRRRGDLDPGAHAVLEVADTGVGIPEDVRLEIFEPFFTTKKKGTGLGLSTAFGIVDQTGGFIRVSSEPGEGTTFRVFLPLTGRPVEEEGGGQDEPARPGPAEVHGGEAVLVVEDEEAVRSVLRRMLERAGYSVHVAGDAEAALRIWDEKDGAFDLLLTDLLLPGMSGIDVAQRLREQKPGLAVLFTSGYSEDELTERVADEFETQFLEKPFAMSDLEEKVRRTLVATAG